MRKGLMVMALWLFVTVIHAQFTHKIKADSVRIYNDNCNAELILENSTKNIYGFLFNKGNGRTEFRKILTRLSDSTFLVGYDTLLIKGSGTPVLNGNGLVKSIDGTISYIADQSANWNSAFAWGNHASQGYLKNITFAQVVAALGYTPYSSSNPAGYITAGSSIPWNTIVNRPTTLAGYGITDALTAANIANQSVNYANTANAALYLASQDTRSNASTPQVNDAGNGIRFDFKNNTINGLNDGGLYNGVMYFRPYGAGTDFSGGPSHEVGFTSNGNLFHRYGNATGWNGWKKIWDNGNLTAVSQLTNDAGYITSSASITGSAGSVAWGNVTGKPDFGGSYQPLENQRLSTSSSPTFTDIYANSWFRNYGTTGLYNQTYANYFYANSGTYWNIGSNGGYGGLTLRDGHEGPVKAYFYWNAAGSGLLNNSGNWAIRANNGGANAGGELYGTWTGTISNATNANYANTAGSTVIWYSQNYPSNYYLVNNWDGTYWNITSNHGSPVKVGYASTAGGVDWSNISNKPNFGGNYQPLENQRLSTGNDVSFGNVYSSGWFRTYDYNGLYNQTYGNHFYASTSGYWNLAGSAGNYGGLVLRNNHQGDVKGYFYWDDSGSGLLNSGGSWAVRVNHGSGSTGGQLYGNWTGTISNANYANSAGSVDWSNVSNRPSINNFYDGWVNYPGYDANTISPSKSGFSYANNAPWNGALVYMDAGGYGLQFSSSYYSNNISFRSRNGDNGTWNGWNELIHAGNIGSYLSGSYQPLENQRLSTSSQPTFSSLSVSSSITAGSFYESSDLRLKNIVSRTPSQTGFDMIAFYWKPGLKRDTKLHYGYVAQEVEKVLPDQVDTDKDGMKSVNYVEVLVKKIAELEKRIAELEKKK